MDIFNGGRTDSGIRVSELTAFQTTTFLACVDLIAGAIAGLPTHVIEKSIKNGRNARTKAYDHPYYDLIHYEPNPDMTAFTFRKALTCHFLVWGNGYAELQRDAANKVVAIWPRNPYKTRPHLLTTSITLPAVPWRPFPISLPAGTLVYKTTDGIEGQDNSESDASNGQERIIAQEDMLHFPGLSFDGRVGQSTVWLARQTIGLALAHEKYGAKYFANFARPSGILTLPTSMKPEAMEQTRRSWQEAQGGENAHRIATMPAGFDFKPISNKPQESQTIESQQFVRGQICAVFHVPPHMVGETDKGRANTEQQGTEFVQYTLQPWLELMRQEYKRKLFPNPDFVGVGRRPQKNSYFIDFDLHSMLRPTAADRQSFYQTGFTTGSLCPNDIRELEGMNPREDGAGDTFYIPVNVQDALNPVVVPLPADQQKGHDDDIESNSIAQLYSRWFRDALGRVMSRSKIDHDAFRRAFSPIFYAIADLLCQQQDEDFRTGTPLPPDVCKFIDDYLGSMCRRSSAWTKDTANEVSGSELQRAINAILTAVTQHYTHIPAPVPSVAAFAQQ